MGELPTKRGHPASALSLTYIFSFIAALVLATMVLVGATLYDGLRLGALVGAGFVATSFGVNYQFSNRPWSALYIDGGDRIVQLSLIGGVLGAWHR